MFLALIDRLKSMGAFLFQVSFTIRSFQFNLYLMRFNAELLRLGISDLLFVHFCVFPKLDFQDKNGLKYSF